MKRRKDLAVQIMRSVVGTYVDLYKDGHLVRSKGFTDYKAAVAYRDEVKALLNI